MLEIAQQSSLLSDLQLPSHLQYAVLIVDFAQGAAF